MILANQLCLRKDPAEQNLVYLIGGTNGKKAFDQIALLDLSKKELVVEPHRLRHPRSSPKGFYAGDELIVFGGAKNSLACESWTADNTEHVFYTV